MNKQWALITASTRGLGREIALELARNGYSVIVVGRDIDKLAHVVNEIHCLGSTCLSFAIDLAPDNAPGALHQWIVRQGVSLSVIVNVLGGAIKGDSRNIDTDCLRRAMRLNLEIGVELNNLFYEDLRLNSGVICHIGSTASLHFDAPPGYVISKLAINGYVKNASKTFGKEGVTIFCVLPGILDHEGSYIDMQRKSNQEKYDFFKKSQVLNTFLTSKECAKFTVSTILYGKMGVNGSLIVFDGGVL